MDKDRQQLVLFSSLAFYAIHWQAFTYLCRHYLVQGAILAPPAPSLPSVHRQLGWLDQQEAIKAGIEVRLMPDGKNLSQRLWLSRQLHALLPDAIWVQEEPTDSFLLQILLQYGLRSRPRIVTAVCENIFPPGPAWKQAMRRLLWRRLDGLLGVAAASIEGIRAAGMPGHVPAFTLVAGALPPPEQVAPIALPFARQDGDFVIGFVGRICEEKGWKVLLAALERLPLSFKCLMAGDGPQLNELSAWLSKSALGGRVFYLGLFPKEQLWGFYRVLDCLAVPSLTFPHWKEQFGGVLADGMAMGIPLVGSDSGAIPEVIGPAGLTVPENNPGALATALQRLYERPDLRASYAAAGRQRFAAEFDIPAYARKIAQALRLQLL